MKCVLHCVVSWSIDSDSPSYRRILTMATPSDRAILNSIINPLLPVGEFESSVDDAENEDAIASESVAKARDLERQGVCFAETGNLEKALELFDNAINESPTWASAYNNKAQALRLMKKDEEAMVNLNQAIELSHGRGKAAAQAYCQSAMLHQVAGREDEALRDWEASARLGNAFAKSQLVQRNPYAALCNKMLCDVFRNLNGEAPAP